MLGVGEAIVVCSITKPTEMIERVLMFGHICLLGQNNVFQESGIRLAKLIQSHVWDCSVIATEKQSHSKHLYSKKNFIELMERSMFNLDGFNITHLTCTDCSGDKFIIPFQKGNTSIEFISCQTIKSACPKNIFYNVDNNGVLYRS